VAQNGGSTTAITPSAVSDPVGGRQLVAGQCERTRVELNGAEPSMPVEVAPVDMPDPGDEFYFRPYVARKTK